MKKVDKRWILFLVLIVALASGLSFLSLHQETETKNPNRTQTMAIAIVNEDQGSTFNGTDLAFGDAFTQSINRNNNHEWFVVSRGVAESGLENNTYDMMVVIPNDFSEKSLNINAEDPEPVVLQYKINASENARIKEEAEKTASNILNDFNRRIIDVYFASVIGNLQDAQDNVSAMVDRQALHTNAFNSNVHQPLSGYTDQFNTIKDQTEHSTNSFSSFEELIESYENQLLEEAEQGEAFVSNIEDVVELKENNLSQLLAFNDMFSQFNQGMRATEVDEKLRNLQTANDQINQQLAAGQNNSGQNSVASVVRVQNNPANDNIATATLKLQNYLKRSSEQVSVLQGDVNNYLTDSNQQFEKNVRTKIEELLDESIDKDININMLFEKPNQVALEDINNAISDLPSLNEEDFSNVGLSEDLERDIKDVIGVTKQYRSEFDRVKIEGDRSKFLKDQIESLRTQVKNGITLSDTVELPKNEKEGQIFTIRIPDGFELQYLGIQLPGEEEGNYTGYIDENGKVKLPANRAGSFTVNVKVNTEPDEGIFDFYKPLEWSWKLKQEDLDDVDKPENVAYHQSDIALVASTQVLNTDTEDEVSKDDSNETSTNEVKPADNGDDSTSDDDNSGEGGNNDGSNEPTDPVEPEEPIDPEEEQPEAPEEEDPEEELPEEPEKLIIKNNTISHQIMTPVKDLGDTTATLINTVSNSIDNYLKLQPLYESYFGHDIHGIASKEGSLIDIARQDKNSLYYLYNEKEIKELLSDYITNQIVKGVSEELRIPAENFKVQVDSYQAGVQQAIRDAAKLSEEVAKARERAAVLNTNLTDTIEGVQSWRDEAMSLLEQQQDIQANAEGEQNAVMTLGSDFQPILSSSQNLADQASNNLNTAENVYQTFEDIDNQATEIEQSGTNLVSNAENLAVEMTDKLENDETFIENFTGVLANSRVGDRQNENLYDFLSNPVETSNEGTITTQNNTFTPYFLVLISFIVVLFTAYVISTINQKKVSLDQFASETSLMGTNMPITIITVGIGLLEGIVIGIVSSYYLPISDLNMLQLTIIMALLVTGMLLVATYLLRQIKMIGMFLLLAVFSLYLFFTDALGSGTAPFPLLEKLSPLQYMETFLLRIVEGTVNYGGAIFIVLMLLLIGALGNLLVINRPDREEEMTDENQAEAG
ncbi:MULTISPECIES: type VII secretion protein EsaA [unclassified Oceanobacillus]|uniref:type VII secretion protein EsaA n=1 Tax=unclassified Oceanobacillus TaxID=2630292 RepID=UPI001BE58757|nr:MULTISPECIES: type VII secretion protein EsaA [unclassified Oceanobacillus]MBT2598939.1 type VII secretion protein EsaA [Oceanobacillus sp. ISL-74]MBT2651858.1 type VII secretion protein EsaA [Oceanobacillus sp. ISL-73]